MSKLSEFLRAAVVLSGRTRDDVKWRSEIYGSRFARILSGRTPPRRDEAARILKACDITCSVCYEVAIDADYARAAGHDVIDEVVVPPPPPRPPLPPLSKLIAVDIYECGDDKIRVEVKRAPGSDDAAVSAHMEMEIGDPACPGCEREMMHVGRKLTKRCS